MNMKIYMKINVNININIRSPSNNKKKFICTSILKFEEKEEKVTIFKSYLFLPLFHYLILKI